jgi:hypothetical protein
MTLQFRRGAIAASKWSMQKASAISALTMGQGETSIVRSNDAAIIDGAIMTAVGQLLECHS